MPTYDVLPSWPDCYLSQMAQKSLPIVDRAGEIAVGSVAFHLSDWRVYDRTRTQSLLHQFRPVVVESESRVCWFGGGERRGFRKRPRNPGDKRLYGLADVGDWLYLQAHAYRIGSDVQRLRLEDLPAEQAAALLRAIEELLHKAGA